jgi:hypothetical protein
MEISKEQISAILFLNQILHPSFLAQIVQSGSREGWLEINGHIEELLKLVPKKTDA